MVKKKACIFRNVLKNAKNFVKEWGGQLVTFIPEIKISQNK